jgi:hypothetical protein
MLSKGQKKAPPAVIRVQLSCFVPMINNFPRGYAQQVLFIGELVFLGPLSSTNLLGFS